MFDCLLRLAYRSVHLSVYLIGLPVLCGQKVRTSEPTYLCYFRRSSPVLCTKQKSADMLCVCVCVCVMLMEEASSCPRDYHLIHVCLNTVLFGLCPSMCHM